MCECKIADRLVKLRIAKGVTQEDVAKKLSVSNKTVSKWENGASAPDLTMLIELAQYYGVSADVLLGIAPENKHSVDEILRTEFKSLTRKEVILKAFDIMRGIIPATFDRFPYFDDDADDGINPFPQEVPIFYRSCITTHDFFQFVASSEDVNVGVMLLRNKSNFEWLNDSAKQKKIAEFFKFLSNEEALSVCYCIHSTACSENFTADYMSASTGVSEERVTAILDELCRVGECHRVTAHLEEGEVKVYECRGDGLILSVIALAYEKMCGQKAYNCNFRGGCKMIGGK